MIYVIVAQDCESTELLWASTDKGEAVETLKRYREKQEEFNARMELTKDALAIAYGIELDDTGYVVGDDKGDYARFKEWRNAVYDVERRLEKELNIEHYTCSDDPDDFYLKCFDGKSFIHVCS